MTEYTAEDFKNARFADHEDGRTAVRTQAGRLWDLGGVRMGDPGMALDGWRPVVEADHPARPLAGYRAQVRELREKVRDLREAPITLDTLREAWENAEVPTRGNPIREGDALISSGHGGYLLRLTAAVEDGWAPSDSYRVLHRAPQPEPWAELADVLRARTGEPDPDETAQMLYEYGVRVVGGDEA